MLNPESESYKTADTGKIRLAKTFPRKTFDQNMWKDGKLINTSVLTPWKAAYNILWVKWAEDKFSTFEEYFNNYNKQFDSPKDKAYLHIQIAKHK